jgi:hypothetical protein
MLVQAAISEIRVRRWAIASRLSTAESPLDAEHVIGSATPVEQDGVTLEEWGFARSKDDGRWDVEGVARVTCTSPGVVAVCARRASSGRVEDEHQAILDVQAGDSVVAALRLTRVSTSDTLSLEVRRLTCDEEQTLRVHHKR